LLQISTSPTCQGAGEDDRRGIEESIAAPLAGFTTILLLPAALPLE
jgi:hypothetical protein